MLRRSILSSMCRSPWWLLFLVTSLFPLCPSRTRWAVHGSTASNGSSSRGVFLWLSDSHLDPYYGQSDAYGEECANATAATASAGRYGCDSPLSLIKETLSACQTVMPNPDFVLITGDFARHGTDLLESPVEQVHSILSQLAQLLDDAFPSSDDSGDNKLIVPAVGNNDFTPDYYIDMTETNNNTMLNNVADAFDNYLLSPSEIASFRSGGYYSRNITSTLTILSINTVIYCTYHQPTNQTPSIISDPFKQFQWLQSQLQTVFQEQTRTVYIVGHIPPTIGSYRKTQFWYDDYITQYRRIVQKYDSIIRAQLFGHLHSDEFRLLNYYHDHQITTSQQQQQQQQQQYSPSAMLLTASVTPIFGSNPSFRLVTYNKHDGRLLDYETYYKNLSHTTATSPDGDDDNSSGSGGWRRLYSFTQTYDVPDLSVSSLKQIVRSVETSSGNHDDGEKKEGTDSVLETFLSRLRVGVPQPPCNRICHIRWTCTLTSATGEEYNSCLDSFSSSSSSSSSGTRSKNLSSNLILAVGAAGAVVIVLAVLLGVRWYRHGRMRSRYDDVDSMNVELDVSEENDTELN